MQGRFWLMAGFPKGILRDTMSTSEAKTRPINEAETGADHIDPALMVRDFINRMKMKKEYRQRVTKCP